MNVCIEGLNGHTITIDSLVNTHEHNAQYTVTLTASGLTATRYVINVMQSSELVSFFKGVASSWRGWSGEKTWASLEGEFNLCATMNLTGTVTLRADLNAENGDAELAWQASTAVTMDIPQLEKVTEQLTQFFEESS